MKNPIFDYPAAKLIIRKTVSDIVTVKLQRLNRGIYAAFDICKFRVTIEELYLENLIHGGSLQSTGRSHVQAMCLRVQEADKY